MPPSDRPTAAELVQEARGLYVFLCVHGHDPRYDESFGRLRIVLPLLADEVERLAKARNTAEGARLRAEDDAAELRRQRDAATAHAGKLAADLAEAAAQIDRLKGRGW